VNTIDFQSEIRKEKNLSKVKIGLSHANEMAVFNLLQDMRHLIIVDFRSKEEFEKSHIRKSILVDL
jgi:hypothetical protein